MGVHVGSSVSDSETVDGISSSHSDPYSVVEADYSCDSFDECVKFCEQQDGILAYYYTDNETKSYHIVQIGPAVPPTSNPLLRLV